MTDKEFCKLDTAFYGEEVDHLKQIALRTFNGEELKEYVEHCIKLHLLTTADVVEQREQLKTEVFTLSNKLAVAGEVDAAVSMHKILNSL